MNQITIAGHLGSDPEVRFTSSGDKVTTLRLAARTRRSSKGGDTIWWRVTIWGEQFDKMIPYLKKGTPLVVCGELDKPEIFTDRQGQPQVSMNVTAHKLYFSPFGRPENQDKQPMLSSYDQSGEQGKPKDQQRQDHHHQEEAQNEALTDEEIPF